MDVRLSLRPAAAAVVLLAAGCLTGGESPAEAPSPTTVVAIQESVRADVTAVLVAGEARAYTFDVTVRSPDIGCDSYADWWEVVTADGALAYTKLRRVFLSRFLPGGHHMYR